MSFPIALTSGNYDSLRGTASVNPTYAAAEYLSLCPGNTVLACRVNGTPTGNSYAQITFDTVTTGAYTDVIPDQRVLISHTNDQRAAFFDGLVRRDGVANTGATATILYINENSYPIVDNDYVWVIDDYPLRDWLPAFAGGVQFKRYNVSFRRLLPYVYGLKSAYAGWITDPADVSTKLRIAFSVTAKAADSGATISAYLWTFPGSATVISGSTTTASVTIDFASSAGNWCHLKVTDSNGNTITRHFFVHAASDTYPPLLTASGVSITGAIGGGYNGSVEAWAGVSSIIDQTFCVAWDEEWYNGTKTSILENIKLVGRFRQQSPVTTTDQTFSQLQTIRYSIEGFAAQLARIEVLPHTLVPASSPTQWDEIKDLTLWRAMAFMLSEHSTFTNLCDLEFDDTTNNFLTAPLNTQKGNLLAMVQDLAQSTNSVWEFAPDGASRIYVDARYRANLDRAALVTVADLTSADWLELTIEEDPPTSVSKVNASGAFYNSTTTVETPLLAIWPGAAQDIGPDEITLARQYLQANAGQVSAQSELNARAAYRGAIDATKIRAILRLPDGYNFLAPSLSQWYTLTVAATDNTLGLVFTTSTRWLCIDVKYDHDNVTGTKSCVATFTIETSASPGQTVQYPSVSEIEPFVPDIPDFGPYDIAFPEDPSLYIGDTATNVDIPVGLAGQAGLKFDGSNLVVWSATQLELLQNFLYPTTTTSLSREITPPVAMVGGMDIRQAAVDPFYPATPNKLPGYALLSDVSNSKVVFNPDFTGNGALAGLPVETSSWQDGALVTGDYQTIRPTNTNQKVIIYNPNLSSSTTSRLNIDFTVGDGGFTLLGPDGVWIPGVGWHTTCDAGDRPLLTIDLFLTADEITTVEIFYSCAWAAVGGGRQLIVVGTGGFSQNLNAGVGSFDETYTYNVLNVTEMQIQLTTNQNVCASDHPNIITRLIINGVNIGVNGGASVCISDDRGATFNPPINCGATPGASAGFDVQASGENQFAAILDGVARSASYGTGYGSYYSITGGTAQAACVIVPYFNQSGASQVSAAHPDIIVALTALDGSSRSLLRVEGGATPGTVHDITPVAGIIFDNPNCVTVHFRHIAVFGKVSGVYKEYRSADNGATWSLVGSPSAPTFIRCRRQDNSGSASGSNEGQLYLCESGADTIGFSRNWAASAMIAKPSIITTPIGLDTVF